MKLRWGRSREGYAESKDGRFFIHPRFMGTTRPQGYELWDAQVKRRVATGDTQKQCKYEAQRIQDGAS